MHKCYSTTNAFSTFSLLLRTSFLIELFAGMDTLKAIHRNKQGKCIKTCGKNHGVAADGLVPPVPNQADCEGRVSATTF